MGDRTADGFPRQTEGCPTGAGATPGNLDSLPKSAKAGALLHHSQVLPSHFFRRCVSIIRFYDPSPV